ncbi:MAG: hypothetical protein KC776_15750 [Myxococcales bacterium]|nr:hypothetical protein [Myxococcales bacterium]MCB9580321.1 hypothetical protein [Polyangiaceae bacterium]
MATKFAEFLEANKIDPRRLLAVSHRLEQLKPEDRRLKLKKRQGGAESAPAAEGEEKKAPPKPRSGRPVTPQLLNAAKEGKKLSGPGKTRLLRAVNRILEQKKKDAVDLRALF